MDNEFRDGAEYCLVEAVARRLVDAGYAISVYSGEELISCKATNVGAILHLMFGGQHEYFHLYKVSVSGYERDGWIHFVFGEPNQHVIRAHSPELEQILAPFLEWRTARPMGLSTTPARPDRSQESK